jgi:transcriptional regulator with XRE-family HTH domain
VRTIDAIANRIEGLCDEHNITINALSYKAGVANSTIKSIFYGKSKNPGVITIKKLCDALDISLIEFFDSAEFEGLDQEIR